MTRTMLAAKAAKFDGLTVDRGVSPFDHSDMAVDCFKYALEVGKNLLLNGYPADEMEAQF